MDTSDASPKMQGVVEHYDGLYLKNDVFGQASRVYRALIDAIVRKSGVAPRARVLDAGCGQGYLSRYLANWGLSVWCSDLSSAGLRSLDRHGAVFERRRVVADIMRPPFLACFDLVFQRSCSLFNARPQVSQIEAVERLTDCVKIGGLICVVYNTDLSGRGQSWFNHNLRTFGSAFKSERLAEVEIYVVNKVDCLLLGRYSFSRLLTYLNVLLSMLTQRGFEIVVFARRCS